MKRPSITTCCPRFFALEHSDCQTGTVVLSAPTPKPRINRPIVNCGNEKLVHSRTSPIKVKTAAKRTVLRRPRISPIDAQASDPNKAPSVQVATIVPLRENVSKSSQLPYHREQEDPHLNCAVRRLLLSSRMNRINLRESRDPTRDGKQPSNARLIVPEQNERRQSHQQCLHQLQLLTGAAGRHLGGLSIAVCQVKTRQWPSKNKRRSST